MTETDIVLEECFNEKGKLLGKIVIPISYLTPEFLAERKADKDDKHGWKKYRKIMKEHGHDIGDEDEQ